MEWDKVSKVPVSIAHPKDMVDIKVVGKSTIKIIYKTAMLFKDGETSLTKYEEIWLSYPKAVGSYDVELDDMDNLIIKVMYKKAWKIFGFEIKKSEE